MIYKMIFNYYDEQFKMTGPKIPRGTFNDIVASNLEEIKKNFSVGLKKNGYSFDEDLFVDVCIRCATTLKDRELSKDECIKYFWTAYNNTRKNMHKSHVYISRDDETNKTCDNKIYNITKDSSQPYNKNIDIICNMICDAVKEKFSDVEYSAWKEKMYDGKTYKEIKEKYGDINLLGIFRKIKKYILQKLPKINREYRERLCDLFE